MAKEFKISSARLQELEAELHHMKTVREMEVAEQIKEARSFGDLSENSEYDEAKNEQAKLYGRIAEVENILANAVIIDELETAGDAVGLGCIVTVCEILPNGDKEDKNCLKSSVLKKPILWCWTVLTTCPPSPTTLPLAVPWLAKAKGKWWKS